MRTPMIAGNWKMNTTVADAVKLVNEMKPELDAVPNVEKVVCPPFVSLASVKEALKGTSIRVGAQNLFFEDKGAYTGEISPPMLVPLCEYVILGHSERRQYFGETSEIVNRKVKAALKAGLKPIMCVGERLEENESGRTEQVITEQVVKGLISMEYPKGFVIAYEPVWAIGTGKAATGEQANEIIGLIRGLVAKVFDIKASTDVRILYGGSVTAANATEFMKEVEIDGALVGGASLKASDFLSIVKQTAAVRKG